MTEESVENAAPEIKRRGPKSKAEIRAEVEAELRAEVEAAVRAEMAIELSGLRAEALAEAAGAQEEAVALRRAQIDAAEAKPISGSDVDGNPHVKGAVTINFVEDGLTMLGKVWFRGEHLTLVPDTKNWTDAIVNVTKGSSETIMFALADEDQQIEKWGKRFFRPGLWRGKRLDEINDDSLTPEEKAQLIKAQKIQDARYGPVLA